MSSNTSDTTPSYPPTNTTVLTPTPPYRRPPPPGEADDMNQLVVYVASAVAGVVVVIILIIAFLFYLRNRRTRQRNINQYMTRHQPRGGDTRSSISILGVNNITYHDTGADRLTTEPLYENSVPGVPGTSNGVSSTNPGGKTASCDDTPNTADDYDEPVQKVLTAENYATGKFQPVVKYDSPRKELYKVVPGPSDSREPGSLLAKVHKVAPVEQIASDNSQNVSENLSPLKRVNNGKPLRAVSHINKKTQDGMHHQTHKPDNVHHVEWKGNQQVDILDAPSNIDKASKVNNTLLNNETDSDKTETTKNLGDIESGGDYVNVTEKLKKPKISGHIDISKVTQKEGKQGPMVPSKPKKESCDKKDHFPQPFSLNDLLAKAPNNKSPYQTKGQTNKSTEDVKNDEDVDSFKDYENCSPLKSVAEKKQVYKACDKGRGKRDKERSKTHIGISLQGVAKQVKGVDKNPPLKAVKPKNKTNLSKGKGHSRSFGNIHDIDSGADYINIQKKLGTPYTQAETLQIRPIANVNTTNLHDMSPLEDTEYEVPDSMKHLHSSTKTGDSLSEDPEYTPMDGYLEKDEDYLPMTLETENTDKPSDIKSGEPPPPCHSNYANFSDKTKYANVF